MAVPVGLAEVRIPFVAIGAPGTYGVVTFGVRPGPGSEPAVIAEEVWDVYVDTMHDRLEQDFVAGPIQVTLGTASGDLTAEGTSLAAGPRSDEMEAPAVAMLIKKNTGLGGRQNRGRNFWPFMLSQDDLTETGDLSPVALADSQTAAFGFLSGLSAAGVPMVLLHRGSSDATDVTSYIVDGRAATQRRRQRR